MTSTRFASIAVDLRERIALGDFGQLGALDSEADLGRHYGVSRPTVRKALERLIRGGVVEATPLGRLRVATERFKEAAQNAAATRPQSRPEEMGATADQATVLRNYLVDGKLGHIPASGRSGWWSSISWPGSSSPAGPIPRSR